MKDNVTLLGDFGTSGSATAPPPRSARTRHTAKLEGEGGMAVAQLAKRTWGGGILLYYAVPHRVPHQPLLAGVRYVACLLVATGTAMY